MLAVYEVTFSCIHPDFRAGRKFLCEECVKKYVKTENGIGLKRGVMSIRKLVDIVVTCEGCTEREGKERVVLF